MSTTFEADVALIHIAGGSSRTTPPPGTIAQAAPRRAARGRSDDLLFLNLSLHPDRTVAPGLTAHLSHLGADAYYGTPGSVTHGLRETAKVINHHLLDANQSEMMSSKLQGRLVAGILRGDNFYVAQCGPGQVVLVRADQATRLTSEEASQRNLGVTSIPYIRYHHIKVQQDDILILTATEPPIWTDSILSTLGGLNPAQVLDRLTPDIRRELTGMVLGIAGPGEASALPQSQVETSYSEFSKPSTPIAEAAPETVDVPTPPRGPSKISTILLGLRAGIRSTFSKLGYSMAKTLARLSPGLSDPQPGAYSTKFLLTTAIVVPVVVVVIASLVYYRYGRSQQFQLNLTEARTAIASAESKTTPFEASEDWELAKAWLEKAGRYGTSDELIDLQEKVQSTLDQLDLIIRLDFLQVVSGGFGPEAQISSLAASSSDLYVLDGSLGTLWHVWWTGRGFEIDGEFQCLQETSSMRDLSTPVGLAIVPEPSALGVESVIGIDNSGLLVYCAPDKIPTIAELSPPQTGWGNIQTFEVYNNKLYVLDSEYNAIITYDASNGFISGDPSYYFGDQIPDLTSAVDIIGSQEGLFILYADGHLDLCNQEVQTDASSGEALTTVCETQVFRDERQGYEDEEFRQIPGALTPSAYYSPPPEPSMYFQDVISGGLYQYSMSMIYQTKYLPRNPLPEEVAIFTIGPPNLLYIAVGNQVYYAQMKR
jgi:hypothetical protein